jgi:hypothetical protein
MPLGIMELLPLKHKIDLNNIIAGLINISGQKWHMIVRIIHL